MINISTWSKQWIQSDESLWGIVEKFKFANVINGKHFFYTFTDETIATFIGRSSLRRVKNLSFAKLYNIFEIDFENYTQLQLSQLKIYHYNISEDETIQIELFFCEKCLTSGFHSIFHQMNLIIHCPYHPKEKLTNKCPKCLGIFRDFNIGYQESAFHCKNCNESILQSENFLSTKRMWEEKHIYKYPIIDILNLNKIYDEKLVFILPVKSAALDFNLDYSRIPYLLNNIYPNHNLAYCRDRYSKFLLTYQSDSTRHVGYNHKVLMDNFTPLWTRSISILLNQVLYTQSKAILKSVERYILKQLDKNKKIQIKNCYDRFGYILETKYSHPFIEWKNECYGEWIYNIRNSKIIRYKYIYEVSDYKEIFPYLLHQSTFDRDLKELIVNINSFSTLINIFNKMLFHFLYTRYLEISINYSIPPKKILSPGILITDNKKRFYYLNEFVSLRENEESRGEWGNS